MKFQPDVLSEQSLIVQFLRYEKQREKILQLLTPFNFLIPEHRNLVWVLFELVKDKIDLNDDVILAYSLQCKHGKPVTFEYLDELKVNYGAEEFDILPLIKKIKKDSYVSLLLETEIPKLIEKVLIPSNDLTVITDFLDRQKDKLSEVKVAINRDRKSVV